MFLKKLEKQLRQDLFCKSCGITDKNLLKVKFNRDTLLKIYPRCWFQHKELKKAPRRKNIREKPAFQTITIELYKRPKTKITTKEDIRLVIVSTGVDVVAKTDDEIYVLSSIKIYSYFSFVFSVVSWSSSCWKYRKWCSYFENHYHHAKMVDKRIHFLVSFYCT